MIYFDDIIKALMTVAEGDMIFVICLKADRLAQGL